MIASQRLNWPVCPRYDYLVRSLDLPLLLLLVLLQLAVCRPVDGEQPRIGFDFPHSVECTAMAAGSGKDGSEKVVTATFKVSVRFYQGDEKDIEQLLIEILSPNERLRIVDFSPKTELGSDFVGEIHVSNTEEERRSLGASIGSGFNSPHVITTPNADVGQTRQKLTVEESDRVPPKRVIVASGTMENEHGVFFKLKNSSQSTLEGVHEITIRFAVPYDWRGDWVSVRCAAQRVRKKGKLLAQSRTGTYGVLLGLHLKNDEEARTSAVRLAHVQRALQKTQGGAPLRRQQLSCLELWSATARELSSRFELPGSSSVESSEQQSPSKIPATPELITARKEMGEFSGRRR